MKKVKPITERVKSFEEACQELGITPDLPHVDHLPEKHQRSIIAYYKLCIITEALNEGWSPDPIDRPFEFRYYPWFYYSGADAGLVFSNAYCVPSDAYTGIGSRLRFILRSNAVYSATQFIDLWSDYLIQ